MDLEPHSIGLENQCGGSKLSQARQPNWPPDSCSASFSCRYLADDALDVPDNAQQLLERLYIFKMYAPLTSASLGKLFTFSAPKLRALAVNCSVAHYALAIEPEV